MREISYKWSVSERWVSKLAQDGRIPGVEQFNWQQAISKYAEKPADVSRPFCTVDDHSIQREGADLKERYYLVVSAANN